MYVFAVLFSHDRGVIAVQSSTADRLSDLLACLYLLQFPVGFLIAFFVTHRITKPKSLVIVASLVASLLWIQMLFSSYVLVSALLEISGDSL